MAADLDQYDKENQIEDSHPSLASFEHEFGSRASSPGFDQASKVMDDAQKQKYFPGNMLKNKEKSLGSGDQKQDQGLYSPASSGATGAVGGGIAGAAKKLVKVVSNNKKTSAIGGGAGAIILTAVLGIGAFVPYELVHLEKTLIKYEAKIEQHFEQKAEDKLLQKLVCQQVANGCKPGTDPGDDDKSPSTADDKAATAAAENPTDPEPLANEMDTEFKLNDPTVRADLAKDGIEVKVNASGQLEELDDSTGNITDQLTTDATAQDELEVGLPEEDVGIAKLQATNVDEADIDVDGFPTDEPADKVAGDVQGEIDNGANGGDTLETAIGDNDVCKPPDCNPADEKAPGSTVASDEGQSGAIKQADDIVTQDLNNGDTVAQAVDDAAAKVSDTLANDGLLHSLSNALLLNAVNYACDIDLAATGASAARVPTIQKLLIRHAALLFTVADQLKSGHLSSGALNSFMGIFNGSSAEKPTTDNPQPQSTLPVTSSAAYQSATGGNGGIAIAASALPIALAGTLLINRINGDIPGAHIICTVITGPFGFVAQGLGVLVQFVGDDFSFGTFEALTVAATTALQLELKYTIIPDVIQYFTPVGLEGKEDSVQWFNNADAGSNLLYGTYSRSIGGLPTTTSTANTLTAEANTDEAVAEAHKPLSTRLFAISDPSSLVSRIVGDLPMGLTSTLSSIDNYLTHFPSIALRAFSSIFTGRLFAQTTPTNPGEPYYITQYALTDTQATQFDPVVNEAYLFSPVTLHFTYQAKVLVKGKMVKETLSGQVSKVRIDVLGNPSSYKPTEIDANDSNGKTVTLGDSNPDDLLHCFVDSFVVLEENVSSTGSFTGNPEGLQTNCGDNNYKPSDPDKPYLGNYQNAPPTDNSFNLLSTTPSDKSIPSLALLNSNIVNMYCQYLNQEAVAAVAANPNASSGPNIAPPCTNQVSGQAPDDIEHYSQYLLDLDVMGNFVSLTNNQSTVSNQ